MSGSSDGDAGKQIAYLSAALKAPRIRQTAARLADQAREAGSSHEDYLAAVLDREVSARNASGAELRIRAAGFPTRKTLDEFTFEHQTGVRRNELGLTQEGLATRTGLHWTFVGQVERGRRNLTLHTVLRVAAGLDIDPGELVTGLKPPTKRESD